MQQTTGIKASRARLKAGALLLGLAASSALAGCATPPPASDPEGLADYRTNNDPFEPTNRVFYAVNDGLLTYVLTPVARGYNYVVPMPVRTGIHNVLNNFGSPVQFANDVLETRPRRAGDTFMRFLINSTAGVGGVFDVAKLVGYRDHSNSGGTTLALWGVPAGPYLYLPVFGSSSVRDGVGQGMDTLVNPYTFLSFNGVQHLQTIETGVAAVDAVAPHVDDLKKLKDGALDPYATFRSLYRQTRRTDIAAARNDHRATVPDWYPNSYNTVAEPPPPSVSRTDHGALAAPIVGTTPTHP